MCSCERKRESFFSSERERARELKSESERTRARGAELLLHFSPTEFFPPSFSKKKNSLAASPLSPDSLPCDGLDGPCSFLLAGAGGDARPRVVDGTQPARGLARGGGESRSRNEPIGVVDVDDGFSSDDRRGSGLARAQRRPEQRWRGWSPACGPRGEQNRGEKRRNSEEKRVVFFSLLLFPSVGRPKSKTLNLFNLFLTTSKTPTALPRPRPDGSQDRPGRRGGQCCGVVEAPVRRFRRDSEAKRGEEEVRELSSFLSL